MSTPLGLFVVFGCVLGGFAMVNGPFGVLIQPSEFVVIGGAAIGQLLIATPGGLRKRVLHAFKQGFKTDVPATADYVELMKCLYQLFQVMRREGVLALESHVTTPASSSILQQFPGLQRRHHAVAFLCDALKLVVEGCAVEDLQLMLDAEMDTHHEEDHESIQAIKTTGDALPGLGIVAAVLGIVVTMSHLGGPPEEIGHHVAAALVGTFLGILLCYGVLAPIAGSMEVQANANGKYMLCIKEGVVAAARGVPPRIAIEFARRAVFSDVRPGNQELDTAFQSIK